MKQSRAKTSASQRRALSRARTSVATVGAQQTAFAARKEDSCNDAFFLKFKRAALSQLLTRLQQCRIRAHLQRIEA
jgi:hypothetical protein